MVVLAETVDEKGARTKPGKLLGGLRGGLTNSETKETTKEGLK